MRYEGTVTVMLVPVTAVGNRTALPKLTTAPVSKPVPVIVSVNEDEPALIDGGVRAVIAGGDTGEKIGTVKFKVCETPPPGCGLRTRMLYWPAHMTVIVRTASCELTTVAPTAPTPVTPPVVGATATIVTPATANCVAFAVL